MQCYCGSVLWTVCRPSLPFFAQQRCCFGRYTTVNRHEVSVPSWAQIVPNITSTRLSLWGAPGHSCVDACCCERARFIVFTVILNVAILKGRSSFKNLHEKERWKADILYVHLFTKIHLSCPLNELAVHCKAHFFKGCFPSHLQWPEGYPPLLPTADGWWCACFSQVSFGFHLGCGSWSDWSCDTLKHSVSLDGLIGHQDPGLTICAGGSEGLKKALSKQRMSEIGACPRPSSVEGTTGFEAKISIYIKEKLNIYTFTWYSWSE